MTKAARKASEWYEDMAQLAEAEYEPHRAPTTDLDVLAEMTDQPVPVTKLQRQIGMTLLREISERVPYLPPWQQRHIAGIVIAYCERVSEQLGPVHGAVYLNAAELIRRGAERPIQ